MQLRGPTTDIRHSAFAGAGRAAFGIAPLPAGGLSAFGRGLPLAGGSQLQRTMYRTFAQSTFGGCTWVFKCLWFLSALQSSAFNRITICPWLLHVGWVGTYRKCSRAKWEKIGARHWALGIGHSATRGLPEFGITRAGVWAFGIARQQQMPKSVDRPQLHRSLISKRVFFPHNSSCQRRWRLAVAQV